MAEVNFRYEPFAHQMEEWLYSRDLRTRAIFWEQGTGKTKLTIDTAAHLFLRGKIDAVLVLAPNGVHRNWVSDEMPAHCPENIPWEGLVWHSSKAKTKYQQRAEQSVLSHKGLAVLAMTYEGILTDKGTAFAKKFFAQRRCLYVLDESARIKTPGAKRTKRILASRKHAEYLRILTGTPVANSPFDIYSQLRFLDPAIWHPLGIRTFAGFKSCFGVFEEKWNQSQGKAFKQLVTYRNLDALKRVVDEVSSRVTKENVLDIPPKLYTRRTFELTPKQKQYYQQLRDEYLVFLDSGEMLTAPLAITRMLRMQQVTCGYLPSDEGEGLHEIPGGNPRLSLLMEILEDMPHRCIVWTRFKKDIELIQREFHKRGFRWAHYPGASSPEICAESLTRFQKLPQSHDEAADIFLGNPASAGEGLTLTEAKTVIYYNNSFKLTDRLQSEDRPHRIGQESQVNYIDILAEGTVDEYITRKLVEKDQTAATITGDDPREWL